MFYPCTVPCPAVHLVVTDLYSQLNVVTVVLRTLHHVPRCIMHTIAAVGNSLMGTFMSIVCPNVASMLVFTIFPHSTIMLIVVLLHVMRVVRVP